MTKKFSELEKKMSPEQLAKSDALFQQMLDEINGDVLAPDVEDWLKHQNSELKASINNMVRAVMNAQQQALNSATVH